MFWNDDELTKRRGARITLPPAYADTGWRPPTEFPNLSAAARISFDTETKDLFLDSEGPGWARGKAHIVGISIGAESASGDRGAWYFPIRHEVDPHDNLDVNNVLGFANHVLNTPNIPKIGANLTYDIGNLRSEGVTVSGPLDDIQFAEALIDSDGLVALDHLGRKYLGYGKETDALQKWCAQAYPFTKPTKWRADIHRSPPRLAGPYAVSDATLPIDIFARQYPELIAQDLHRVYRVECDLIPLMIDMRFEGITVDVERAVNMIETLEGYLRETYQRIYHEFGYNLQSTSSGELAGLFKHLGIQYPETKDGNPSFRKEWLAGLEHPVSDLINEVREQEKIIGTFLKGYIIDKSVPIPGTTKAKLYPQFHQLKNDENGTIVGRFSSSDPNLQNIPARSKAGKKVRTCFVKDIDHHNWKKFDQSQIHYRILAHYAVGPGSDELRDKYINDPATDYHWNVYRNVAPIMGWDISDDELNEFRRRPIKNVNFGLLYGQSEKALKYKTAMYFGGGFGDKEASEFFAAYFKGAPYVKPTMKAIGEEVQTFGYVTTLLGRRIRFNLWEPSRRERGVYYDPLPYDAAIRAWGPMIRRAFEYRGVNYKFQGSEPDVMKKGMLDCYNSGVFNYTGVPRVTVHDEINFSVRDDSPVTREAFRFIQHTMTNCIKMRVPLKVDEEEGLSWGEVKKVKIAA